MALAIYPKVKTTTLRMAFFVCLEHFEQFEADVHPLLGGNELGSSVGDTSYEVDAVFLYFFVSVSKYECETG